MLFIQYDSKGFGWFEVKTLVRCTGGWKNGYKTIRRKLKFNDEGKPRIFYNGELRPFTVCNGSYEEKDYQQMLDYFKL